MARGPVFRQKKQASCVLELNWITEIPWNKYDISHKSLEVAVKHLPKAVRNERALNWMHSVMQMSQAGKHTSQ